MPYRKINKMTCKVCGTDAQFNIHVIKEMMFGFRDEFNYLECLHCGCFQIEHIPSNMEKYYPANYYSFQSENKKEIKLNYFKTLQFNQISGYKKTLPGAIVSYKYSSEIYHWFKFLQVSKKESNILDIGCGQGELLKDLFVVGFQKLTGIDPYIEKDIRYNQSLHVYKKEVFDVREKYDLVMMHHSFEHMADQPEVLNKIHQILNQEGKLLIRIPVISKPLIEKYGMDMVSLDAPRHFFIHTIKSINLLLAKAGFSIYRTEFDSQAFEFIASEQYKRGISIYDPNSYFTNPKKSVFTKEDILNYKKQINKLNADNQGSTAVFYIQKST